MRNQQRSLSRKCRHHLRVDGVMNGCYYCRRKYLTDIHSLLSPEDRLLRQIFGEDRFYFVNPKKRRNKRK
jgi:hypothetical protein